MSDFSPVTVKPSLAEVSDTTIRQRKVQTDTASPKVEHLADTTAQDDNGKQKASEEEINWGKTPSGDGKCLPQAYTSTVKRLSTGTES